jgi:hypothetical protein
MHPSHAQGIAYLFLTPHRPLQEFDRECLSFALYAKGKDSSKVKPKKKKCDFGFLWKEFY